MILAKILVGAASTLGLAAAIAFHQGAVILKVQEHRADGEHFSLILPGAMFPLAAKLVPDQKLREIPEEAREMLPAMEVVAQELRRLPDAVLVEVRGRNEYVRVEKRGGLLIVDADDGEDRVYLSVPLRSVGGVLREMREANDR